jgi:hypothetical protein
MHRSLFLTLFSICLTLPAQTALSSGKDATLYKNAKAATVVILSGEGSGRLHSLGTGVLIRADGTILTALHVVKGAAEVQVRLANGDVFDHMDLLGADERRDIAALKISATGVPFLPPSTTSEPAIGEAVYAVTNASGLNFSATAGILSAVRPAAEIPGAGSGFTLLQFTAPIAPGSSGSALLDGSGDVIGVITSGLANAGFAVPIQSVLGLADNGHRTVLGSGALLQLPAQKQTETVDSSAALADVHPKELLKRAKTLYLHSKTSFLTIDTLQRALLTQKGWDELGLVIVGDPRLADVLVEIDRPLFTYVHTFVLTDRKTSIVLGAGKVTAFDGTIASGFIGKDIVKMFADAHSSASK